MTFCNECGDELGVIVVCGQCYKTLKADADSLASVLEWYAVQGENCRKHGLEGERARNSLDRDGGSQARAALAAHERGEG
jgi:hypothetical protein